MKHFALIFAACLFVSIVAVPTEKTKAATGFLRNWSNETGRALGFTFGVVIIVLLIDHQLYQR